MQNKPKCDNCTMGCSRCMPDMKHPFFDDDLTGEWKVFDPKDLPRKPIEPEDDFIEGGFLGDQFSVETELRERIDELENRVKELEELVDELLVLI